MLGVAPMPTDLVIVLDRSAAMAARAPASDRSRWAGVTAAVGELLANPGWAPEEAALVLLGTKETLFEGDPCAAPASVEPIVPFTAITDGGVALLDALRDTVPAGLPPLEPVLVSALELARERAAANPPERATRLVVIAASDPTACDGPAAIAAAAAVLRDEDVRTHVIGFGEVALEPLDALAAAGGTSLAMWVEETNLELELVNALRVATAPPSDCVYRVPESPPGMELDFRRIQVTYRDPGDETREAPAVADAASCDGGGYYLVTPVVPQELRLCPCTCADATPASLVIEFPCEPLAGE